MSVSQVDKLANGGHSIALGPHAGKLWWGWGTVDGMREHAPRILEAHSSTSATGMKDPVIIPLSVFEAGAMYSSIALRMCDPLIGVILLVYPPIWIVQSCLCTN